MIIVKDLHKKFDQLHVLKGINQEVKHGEVVVVVGPSGSGKSTFLRCINLLEMPTEGEIIIAGESITQHKVNINRIREKVGLVFQNFNLFPHLTILDNIILAPMKIKGISRKATKRAKTLLEKAIDKIDAYPVQLSGDKTEDCHSWALAMEPEIMF